MKILAEHVDHRYITQRIEIALKKQGKKASVTTTIIPRFKKGTDFEDYLKLIEGMSSVYKIEIEDSTAAGVPVTYSWYLIFRNKFNIKKKNYSHLASLDIHAFDFTPLYRIELDSIDGVYAELRKGTEAGVHEANKKISDAIINEFFLKKELARF